MSENDVSANDSFKEPVGAETPAASAAPPEAGHAPPESDGAAGSTAAPQLPRGQPAPGRKITPGDLVLGSVLLASDAVGTWIDEQAPAQSDVLAGQTSVAPVLLSQAQWEETFGLAESSRARYAAIGLAVTTQSRLSRAGKALVRAGDEATGIVLKPLRRSRLLSPVRDGFNHLAEVGEARVDRWVAIGREREARSRAMTKATLNQIVNDSVNLLTDEPHVQVLVQEIVAGQSLGVAQEIIEEVRKRAVSLDLRVEKLTRRVAHRAPRETLPGPNFTVRIAPRPRDEDRLLGKPNLAGQYAGFASRLMAFVIDLLVIIVGLTIAGMFVTSAREIFHIGALLQQIFGLTPNSNLDRVLAAIVTPILAAAYWIISWWLTGASIGKTIMGLRVVGPNGKYPTFWRSVGRYIGYLVIALSLGVGFLWILIDNRRQGWDDKIAGTFVVYGWPAHPDETFLH